MFEKMRQFLVKNVNIWKIACMSPALFLLSLAYQRKIMQIFSDINRNVIFICAFIKSKTKETETNSRFSQTVELDLFNGIIKLIIYFQSKKLKMGQIK